MESDDILGEVADFKRRLASVVDLPQERKPPPLTVNRFTQLPEHPLVFSGDTFGEYRYPGLPDGGASCAAVGTVYVTISAATICGCVIGGGGTSSKLTALSLNGVYTCTGTPGVHSWETSGAGSWARQNYSDETCTTDSSDDSGDFEIFVTCTGGVYSVSVSTFAGDFSLAANCASGFDYASYAFSVSETP